MKTRKAQKLVSLLLAVMLVIGMLPISALAADVAIGTATGNDCVDISLSVSRTFGGTGEKYTFLDDLVVSSIDDYKRLIGNNWTDYLDKNCGIMVAGKKYDGVYDASKSALAATDGVNVGDTVYVGFKTQLKNPTSYEGVYSATIKMYYNKTEIESLNGDADIGAPGTTNFIDTMVVNGVTKNSGARFETKNNDALNITEKRAWAGDFALDRDAVSLTDIGNDMVEMTIKYGGTYYHLPTDTTWDVVVPMVVKKVGTIDLKLDPTLNNAFEGVGVSTVANGGALINGFVEITTDQNGVNFFTHSASLVANNFSAAPSGTYTTGAITNRKQTPYIPQQEAVLTANGGAGPFDTLTFPADENTFKEGDTVIFYSDNAGNTKLFEVVISSDNVLGDDGWGKTLTTDQSAAGLTLRLTDEDGKSFLHTQSKVYIGRLEKNPGEKTVNKYALKEATFAPESTIYFSGNLAAPTLGSSKATAIQVKVGDPISTVLDKFDQSPNQVLAPTETDADYSELTTLDWTKPVIEVARKKTPLTYATVNTTVFGEHGDYVITIPFKSFKRNDITYTQPTAYVTKGVTLGSWANADVPVYGQKIYVKVLPNPADYYIVNDVAHNKKTLTLSGGTIDSLKPGSVIQLYSTASADGTCDYDTSSVLTIEAGEAGANRINPELTIADPLAAALPLPTDTYPYVWVTVRDAKNEYTNPPVQVDVLAPNQRRVTESVVYEGPGEDGKVLINSDATVLGIFSDLKPTFHISGVEEAIEVDLATVAANTKVYTSSEHTAANEITVAAFDSKKEKESEAYYELVYEIQPHIEAAQGSSLLPLAASVSDYSFDNKNEYTITIKASVVKSLKFGNSEGETIIAEKTNNPDGTNVNDNYDSFQVTNCTSNEAQAGDTVQFYKGNTPVEGLVGEITAGPVTNTVGSGETQTYTYTIKVKQLGRVPESGLSFKVHTTHLQDTLDSKAISLGDFPKEKYVFEKVAAYDPSIVTVAVPSGDPTIKTYLDGQKAMTTGTPDVPTKIKVKVAYNGADGQPDAATEKVLETPVGTYTYASPVTDDTLVSSLVTSDADPKSTVITATAAAGSAADLKVTDGETEIGVQGVTDGQLTANFTLIVSNKTYDGPAISTIAAATKVSNNRFPEADGLVIAKDGVTINSDETSVDVYYYASQADAEARAAHVAKVTLTKAILEGTDDVTAALGSSTQEVLAKNGGKLYVRALEAGAPMTDIATVNYGIEDYTLWTVDVADDAKVIKKNRADVNEKKFKIGEADELTDAQKLAYLTGLLPDAFTFTAKRFAADGSEETQNGSVILSSAPWKMSDGTDITLDSIWGESGDHTAELKATLTGDHFPASGANRVTVSYIPADETSSINPGVQYALPTGLDVEREDDLTAEVKLYATQDEDDTAYETVADPEKYIIADNSNTDDYKGGNPTDDKITIWIAQDSTGKAPTEEGFNADDTLTGVAVSDTVKSMKNAGYSFTIDGVTYYGALPAPEGETPVIKVELDKNTTALKDKFNNTVTFAGFPADMKQLSITFYASLENAIADKNGSDPVKVDIPEISGKQVVKTVTSPLQLKFFTGMVHADSDLTDLVKSVTKVTIVTEANETVNEVPLAGSTVGTMSSMMTFAGETNVTWTLWQKGMAADAVWTKVTSDYADALSVANAFTATKSGETVTAYTKAKDFRLTAELDLDKYDGEVSLDNPDNVLAEIPITLYNSEDQTSIDSFELKLTAGNSDLAHAGEDKYAEAAAELTKRQADHPLWTKDSYKNDLVLYFFEDSYDTAGKYADGTDKVVVKDYLAKTAFQSLTGVADVQDILTDDNCSWTELNSDGQNLKVHPVQFYGPDGTTPKSTADHIEPHHSDSRADYVVFSTSYCRLDENYIIRYTLNYDGTLYVVDRKVKIRYMLGDLDFSGRITEGDSVKVSNIIGNMSMFQPRQSDDATYLKELEKTVGDLDNSGRITEGDSVKVSNIIGNVPIPNMRW